MPVLTHAAPTTSPDVKPITLFKPVTSALSMHTAGR